jgi:hypothetical protein
MEKREEKKRTRDCLRTPHLCMAHIHKPWLGICNPGLFRPAAAALVPGLLTATISHQVVMKAATRTCHHAPRAFQVSCTAHSTPQQACPPHPYGYGPTGCLQGVPGCVHTSSMVLLLTCAQGESPPLGVCVLPPIPQRPPEQRSNCVKATACKLRTSSRSAYQRNGFTRGCWQALQQWNAVTGLQGKGRMRLSAAQPL